MALLVEAGGASTPLLHGTHSTRNAHATCQASTGPSPTRFAARNQSRSRLLRLTHASDPARGLQRPALNTQQRGTARAAQGFGSSSGKGTSSSNLDTSPRSLKEKAAALAGDLRGTSIFLLGMMGSGKSTVGRLLADALGYYFFDSDEVVEQAAGGATVSQIFVENGEEAFRDMETKVLAELSSLGRLVVSTGGGAILRPTNWSFLQHGVTVYIDVPVPVLAQRVVAAGTQSRPLLAEDATEPATRGAQDEEITKAVVRLQSIFSERSNLYRNADSTVSLQRISDLRGISCEEVSPEDIALEVVESINRLVIERKQRDQVIRARAGP